jgi:hypothetical protein
MNALRSRFANHASNAEPLQFATPTDHGSTISELYCQTQRAGCYDIAMDQEDVIASDEQSIEEDRIHALMEQYCTRR